ncbi:MAG: nuclear transport factor 2 family protein [Promethearchaeota archaeon]|jgi:hypothetical protein
MKPLDLALLYMQIFYSEKDVKELREISAKDLTFIGPLYKYNSAQDYINSLIEDPPGRTKYEIVKSFEDENSACLIYQFSKEGVSVPMAQMFEVENDKIKKINLIFDTVASKK